MRASAWPRKKRPHRPRRPPRPTMSWFCAKFAICLKSKFTRQHSTGCAATPVGPSGSDGVVDIDEIDSYAEFFGNGATQSGNPVALGGMMTRGDESRAGDRKSTRLNSSH